MSELIAGYTTVLDTDMATAEERVRQALQAEGFGVLTEIDVAATLKAKLDLDRAPLKILGACNPVLASQVLERDVSLSLMLPCNVVLEAVAEGVRVRAIDPLAMLPGDEMADLAADAGARLARAVASLQD
jgi:uncharacterized protein (DUF302 family)